MHIYVHIAVCTGAAEANFDWSGAHGLVAGCSMGVELGKHVTCACTSFSSNYWSSSCRVCWTCSAAPVVCSSPCLTVVLIQHRWCVYMNYLSKHVYMYPTFEHTLYIYSTCTLASYPGGGKTAAGTHCMCMCAIFHGDRVLLEYVRILMTSC